MIRLGYILIELLCAAVFLTPALAYLHIARFRSIRKSICFSLFTFYLAAVYYVVGLPTVNYIRFEMNMSWIPVIGMLDDWKNSILNVLLFIPLGFFLPILCAQMRSAKTVLIAGMETSVCIELLQIFTYRATDVNDIITNTFGAFLGYLIADRIGKHRSPEGKMSDVVLCALLSINVMFFLQPFVSGFVWKYIL